MTARTRGKPDPLERQIESALEPGRFVSYHACWSFVSALEEVEASVAQLLKTDPVRAAALYETFLAGCHEKVEEVDDSSGCFGQFVETLFVGWVKARNAAAADPDETASRLLAWMDDDPYGFCHGIEKELAKVLDRVGLATFARRVRERFETIPQEPPSPGGSTFHDPDHFRRRWGEVLRTLYLAQKNSEAYLSLAEATGLTPQDCHALATIFAARRKPQEALAWVERGIDLSERSPRGFAGGLDLAELKRKLLTKLGRGGEALDAARAAYREHPCPYAYDELMEFVPKAERSVWHEKAVGAVEEADLASAIELFLHAKEPERLVLRLRAATDAALEQLSHYVTEPAAKNLERAHPDVAARLWRAQGLRIVNAGKSKYYDAALRNLERAKKCFEKAGNRKEWQKTVDEIHARHHRKTGFIVDFEKLAAGRGPSTTPSFLERAKARWTKT